MKKFKLITPVVASASLVVIAASSASLSVSASNNSKKISKTKSEIVKAKTSNAEQSNFKAISIDVNRTDPLEDREFINSESTSIEWENGDVEDAKLTSIGNSTFAFSKLQSVVLPPLLTNIGPMAFYHCDSLDGIDLSLVQDTMLTKNFTLGLHAFQDAGTSNGTIGYRFKKLSETTSYTSGSFEAYELVVAYIKAMLHYSGSSSGWYCNIKNEDGNGYMTPSNTYKAIPVQLFTFNDNGVLTNINVSKITKANNEYDTIIFPKYMTGISDDALEQFQEIKELGTIKTCAFISDPTSTLTTIPASWFQGWDGVEKIFLPSQITTLEPGCFAGCYDLNKIDLSLTKITSLPQTCFENAGTDASSLTVTLPSTLQTIPQECFLGSNIRTLDIPTSCTTIANSACKDCKNLRSITVSSGLTEIGQSAFAGCTNLTDVTWPATPSLTTIGANAFQGCESLQGSFALPNSMFNSASNGTIGEGAFSSLNSNKYQVIDFTNCDAAKIDNITFGTNTFDGWQTRGTIKCPDAWTNAQFTKMLTKLKAAGLQGTWVRSTDINEHVLSISYDLGTSLQISPDYEGEGIPTMLYKYKDSSDWAVLDENFPGLDQEKEERIIYIKGENLDGFTKKSSAEGFDVIGQLKFTNNDNKKGITIYGDVMGLLNNGGEKTVTNIPNAHCFDKLFAFSTAAIKFDESTKNFFGNTGTLTENCFEGMFYNCAGLQTAPKLPATTLAKQCYKDMFYKSALTTMPNLPAQTLTEGCYQGMFKECTKLVQTDGLNITKTVLAKDCYKEMFKSCTSIQTAPELPQTYDGEDDSEKEVEKKVSTLTEGCYSSMFEGCTNLTAAPKLTAYDYEKESCKGMFKGCTSLVNAPTIYCRGTKEASNSSSVYKEHCFESMFEGCTALKTMKVHFKTWPTTGVDPDIIKCTENWAKDLTTGGKFYCCEALPHDESLNFNIHEIPIGWTVEFIEEKKNPLDPEQVNEDSGAKVDKDTDFSLFQSSSCSTAPNLWYIIYGTDGKPKTTVTDGGVVYPKWTKITSSNITKGSDGTTASSKIRILAGETIYFRGHNDTWSHEPSGTTWSHNYASLVFTNPNGYSKGSTGVHVIGNVMSLVIPTANDFGIVETSGDLCGKQTGKGVYVKGPSEEGGSEWTANFCFYGLYFGPGTADEEASYYEKQLHNNHEYNYCIEDVAEEYFSVPNLTKGLFARTFTWCENMEIAPKIWSREQAGFRKTKKFAFADTFKGCAKMTEPADMNLDMINSYEDGFWTFHGTFYQCPSLLRAADMPIYNITNCKNDNTGTDADSNSQTWQLCYSGDKALKEVKWYVNVWNQTTGTRISAKTWHARNFDGWLGNCGYNYFYSSGSETPIIYMYSTFYTWLTQQFTSDYSLYGTGGSNGNLPMSSSCKWVVKDIDTGAQLN